MKSNTAKPGIWKHQFYHYVGLLILLYLTFLAWQQIGKPLPLLFWSSISVSILHQVFVWLTWRLELKNQFVSRTLGFKVYLVTFFVLLGSRPILAFFLAYSDSNSFAMPPMLQFGITTLLLIPWIYLAFSVKKYFGFIRAAGADHFDASYRKMRLVNQGIFQYTNNGMYIYGFLIFWALAIGFASKTALVFAAFSHAYIWIHFYCTEKPDLEYIYSE